MRTLKHEEINNLPQITSCQATVTAESLGLGPGSQGLAEAMSFQAVKHGCMQMFTLCFLTIAFRQQLLLCSPRAFCRKAQGPETCWDPGQRVLSVLAT